MNDTPACLLLLHHISYYFLLERLRFRLINYVKKIQFVVVRLSWCLWKLLSSLSIWNSLDFRLVHDSIGNSSMPFEFTCKAVTIITTTKDSQH